MKLWDCRRVLDNIRKVTQQAVAWSCVQLHGHRQRGVTLGLDIRRSLTEQPSVIFDVGAHHGESIDEFKAWFPKATIYCFEPAHEAFTILSRRTSGNPRIICHNSALSEAQGKATIHIRRGTDNSSLTAYAGQHELEDVIRKEDVTVDTIDDYASAHGVKRIDFLKIDTEGLDLKVLLGARRMFDAQSVGIVQVEAAMLRQL